MRFRYLTILFLGTLPIAAQVKGNPSPEVLYAKCKASVVTILTFDVKRAPLGQGSGFIVAKNRVVTNYHVVAGSTSASIVFDDASIAVVKAVVAGSGPKDLVIVEAETGNRAALGLGDELQLKVGETIYAIGAPNGLSASLSNGLVSAFRQDEGQFLIQITAPIAPGSSGGPLLNSQGQVVGVTTSRLKDGSFSFAMGAGDVQHLLKVPLGVKIQLSDLTADETATPSELNSVQVLFEQKKYEDARASFNALSAPTKTSFEGQLLLCKIEQEKKDYQLAIQACDAAIQSRPNVGEPYGLNALSLLMLGNTEQAEAAASKAAKLSDEIYYKNLLGLVHYSEEKYELVPKEFPADSNDTFVLTLLAGAAFHNRDYDSFRRFRDKVTALKGDNNGWMLFAAGVAAEKDLNWDVALDKYRKCDADSDFIDPICLVAAVRTELRQINYSAAKSDMDSALSRYPKSHDVLSEGVFINLLVGNTGEADRLHELLKKTAQGDDEGTDCLYYYGRNQPLLATGHCEAAIRGNGNNYSAWSNAGYAALDNGDFQSAVSRFSKAVQLFDASKEKHTGTQELDVCWGLIVAEYYSGDKKTAKNLYRALKKDYPEFVTTTALKRLPLVWSDGTVKLIDKVAADFK
jgi:tetratricopeptide (TPR) repeat protein